MRIVFMGTPDFAVPSLKALLKEKHQVVGVVTQPDRPKGRKREVEKPPVKILAELMGIEVFQPEKIREKSAIARVLDWEPELIVAAAYGQIIPNELLETPEYKAINVHASLLPKFRGASPIHQSIIQGEEETGITIMYMVKELDAGDILSQEKITIEEEDTAGTLHDKLAQVGAKLLTDTIAKMAANKIDPKKQDDSLVTYAPILKRKDEWIDWNKASIEISNQIRGLNPWPIAYTHFRGDVFKVWLAKPIDDLHMEEPGTVLEVTKDKLVVAAKKGAVELLQVQPAGKKKMEIAAYLQGANVIKGEKMGEAK